MLNVYPEVTIYASLQDFELTEKNLFDVIARVLPGLPEVGYGNTNVLERYPRISGSSLYLVEKKIKINQKNQKIFI